MPTRNVNLTEHFDHFIDTGIESGRFSNASEVVREGLRLLEQQELENEAKLEWLRGAAKEGFDAAESEDIVAVRSPKELDQLMGKIHKEVSSGINTSRSRRRKGA